MKQKFSTAWKASSQPRKQRKYAANAPLHLKRKMLSVNLTKDLRKKHGMKNIPVRKGDVVIVMRGRFKKKKGKVNEVKTKMEKIYVEGIQTKKRDGSTVNVPSRASNLQIVELNVEDRKRVGKKVETPKGVHQGGASTSSRPRDISKEMSTRGKKINNKKSGGANDKIKESKEKDSKTNEGATPQAYPDKSPTKISTGGKK